MSEDTQQMLIAATAIVLFSGAGFASCNYANKLTNDDDRRQQEINAKAPMVETCVKHPITAPPF